MIVPQQPIFARLSKLLRFSPRTNTLWPGRNDQPRDPLDFPVTLPLPLNRLPLPPLPGGRTFFNHARLSVKGKQKDHEPQQPQKLSMLHSDKLHTVMLSVWTTENDHMFSSFASAGSRKRRRSKFPSWSMMTNLRTTNRKMVLIQSQCLLPARRN